MREESYEKLYRIETTPAALDETRKFLAEKMRVFMSRDEPVLICFPDDGPKSLGGILGQAVRDCGGVPVFWGPDYRWKSLLRQAFLTHAHTIVGNPQVILGLMKVARVTKTPLNIHNAVITGSPYGRWMLNDLKKGLDCRIWCCYSFFSGPIVVGFTCDQEAGLHVREDRFQVGIRDAHGNPLPPPGPGALVFRSAKDPELFYDSQEIARLMYQPCSCGSDAIRIMGTAEHPTHDLMEEQLLGWSSVLDYRIRQTDYGTDLELVVFLGESLPQLPSCARLTVRPWDPETDIPFAVQDRFVK